MAPTAFVIAALAACAFAPAAAGERSGHELLRGGLQVSVVPETPGPSGAAAQNPAQLNVRPTSKRKPASDPGAELRTQGGLRRDAFRLLLGGD